MDSCGRDLLWESALNETLRRTPLYDLHVARGGKMVPFAGYEMPVQFADGILKEHLHTRAAAGLFDVSHMGQVRLHGAGAAAALERLVPGDIQGLGEGRMRYTQFTNESGGILDDLMVTRTADHLFLVVNAACKDADIAHLQSALPSDISIEPLPDRALLALQGPKAVDVLSQMMPEIAAMKFMSSQTISLAGADCIVSRCGYTGEDGFELSIPADRAVDIAEKLLEYEDVLPIGLGARDSLRLEAGLCLYGHDIDETTTPIEAELQWSIGKRRRADGGFPGDSVIQQQIQDGVSRKRVGIRSSGRAPVRENASITDLNGDRIGTVTSGGFGPSIGGPVAMGYVTAASAEPDTEVNVVVRNKPLPAAVATLPFSPHRYYRGK